MQCLSSLLLIFYNGIFVSANILLRLARSTCTAQCEDGVTKRHRKARYWSSKFSKVSLIELRTLHNFETPFSFIFMKLFWTIHNMLSYCICMMYINTCISISRRILLKWCHLAKIQQRAREGGRYLMETDSATGFICFESVRLCWLNKFLCSEKKASYETVQVLQLKSIFHKGLSAIKQLSLWISPVLNPRSSETRSTLQGIYDGSGVLQARCLTDQRQCTCRGHVELKADIIEMVRKSDAWSLAEIPK